MMSTEYLTRTQVAARLQISRETLRILRRETDFPQPVARRERQRPIVWLADDVEKWMESRA